VRVKLTKHEALGNDFLVLFDDQPLPRLPYEVLAQRWCHRRRGVGADGLLVGLTGPNNDEAADLGMALFNVDGTRAELSGNGLRCLAQAWAERHHFERGEVRIATDAGLRTVTFEPGERNGSIRASVTMGTITALPPPSGWAETGIDPARPALHVSVGNPHSVVAVEDVDVVDLATIGALVPDVNLEIVEAAGEQHAVRMRVHERGAGITEACGTGACAAAWAASCWGLAEADQEGEITVHMDGGSAKVRLGEEVILTGPSTTVASIELYP
jgi:diaminopimelate epimerase